MIQTTFHLFQELFLMVIILIQYKNRFCIRLLLQSLKSKSIIGRLKTIEPTPEWQPMIALGDLFLINSLICFAE